MADRVTRRAAPCCVPQCVARVRREPRRGNAVRRRRQDREPLIAFITFDSSPQPKVENDAHAKAQDFPGEAPSSRSILSRAGSSKAWSRGPKAIRPSWAHRAPDRCEPLCQFGLTCSGNPQVRINRASFTVLSPASRRPTYRRMCPGPGVLSSLRISNQESTTLKEQQAP